MNIRITYCVHCYSKQARSLADELAARPDAAVELVEGKLGQFDVLVDDELIASRGEGFMGRMLKRGPELAAIVGAIDRHVGTEDGEHCELPTTPRTR